MRWYVEVSRVGENSVADEYCVEAKQWQAALQEARKLRGDTGALSKFSIELLDQGYRAVDPALKLRYLINEAPEDAKLSEEAGHVARVEMPSAKPVASESLAPTAFSTSVAPAAVVSNGIPRPASLAPPRPTSAVAPRATTSAAPPRSLHLVVVPDDEVPPAPRLPGGLATSSEVPRPTPAAFELVRERAEEPRPDSPITYRECAYAVPLGTPRPEIEALLHERYQETLAAIWDRPPGKFVQLAVFDHAFQRRPERPPLATLVWKDWRGGPVLAFPGFGEAPQGPQSRVPPELESSPSPGGPSVSASPPASLSVLPLPPSLAAPSRQASVAPASARLVPMTPVVLSSRPAPALPTASPAVQASPGAAPDSAAPSPTARAPVSVSSGAASFELNFEPPAPNAPSAAPSGAVRKTPSDRPSRPRLAVGRRRAGEDLITELFEIMHELHFARDVAAGAQFVLSVLDEVLPCEGALIHVFDINTSHFVVVRAKGPSASSVLLQRMSDQDPLVKSVMRSPRAVSIKEVTNDPRVSAARWQAVGVTPTAELCGAVQQGGRYLGLIELVNPQGDAPFHLTELNALDYICEQFAEFLSKKPIVLTADVVLARS